MKTAAVLFLVFMFWGGTTGFGQDKVFRVAADPTFPPMEYVDEDRELAGFDIDLVKEIARRAHFQLEIQNVAWDEIFDGLDGNHYNAVISAVSITPERQLKFDFSQPYLESGMVLAVRAASPFQKISDLKGKKVGAMNYQSPQDVARAIPGSRPQIFDEETDLADSLDRGTVDAVYIDFMVFSQEKSLGKIPWKLIGGKLTRDPIGIVFPQGDEGFKSQVDQALTAMKQDGTLDKLLAKWNLAEGE